MIKLCKYLGVVFLLFMALQSKSQILADSSLLAKDKIELTYKWKKPCLLSKNKTYRLQAQIKNMNDYDLRFAFQIAFYKSGIIVSESDTIVNCLSAGQKIKGRKYALVFDTKDINYEDIRNEAVVVEFIPVEILKMRSCKK